ncbi:hypothetical protein TrLO_g11475 [Triparma laevis f. longispina]|uniref:Uncharacterized protein n=1 Tax=Triparma laevis f. longispina TaxID=1714387 RepID=A0A9W7F520_9STRA|nr:hypothetical protein TrLO_g11475 [Triparma laevis f. longispina]
MDEPLLVATNPNPGGGMPDAAPPPAFKTPQQHLNPDADCPPSDRPITGREANQNPPARDSASTEKTPKATVAIVFLLFVVLRAMDRVFNKRVQDRMVNYQLMYMNVLWPIGVQVMTVFMCWIYVEQQNAAAVKAGLPKPYDYSFFLPGARFASKRSPDGKYPQWRLGLFSFWDEVNAVFTSLPGPYINLTMQSILTNLNVVWTVGISIFYLKATYFQAHYAGCIIIILSGLVAVTVELQSGTGLNSYTSATGEEESTSPLWYIIFILGTIPAGISNCYKEKVLKTDDLDIMYAVLWSGYWQIIWGFVMFPINWIRMPEPAVYNAPGDTWKYVQDTWTCFKGVAPDPINTQDLACESAGGSAAVWFMVYLVFNVAFNVLMLWLTKKMSATWATIGTVLCLDLTSLFSMSKLLMGDEATPVTLEQYFGLFLAGVGMWVYNLEDEDETHWEAMRREQEQEARGGRDTGVGGGGEDVEVGQGESFIPRNTDVSFASDRTSSFGMWTKRAASTSSRSMSRSQSFTQGGGGVGRRFSHGNVNVRQKGGGGGGGGGVRGSRVDFSSPPLTGTGTGTGGDHSSRWSSAA